MNKSQSEYSLADKLSALKNFSQSKKILRECGIARSERIVGEIGEWYFIQLFGGKLAPTTSAKGWDVECQDGKKIQIKTHAKSSNNNARWTEINPSSLSHFDELYIFVFSQDLILRSILFKKSVNIYFKTNKKEESSGIVNWKDMELMRVDFLKNNTFFKFLRSNNLVDYREDINEKH